MSTTYHSIMSELSERTNQVLDGELRAWVCLILEEAGVYLYRAEFSYINNYHSSNKYVAYEMLYERKCRSPVLWTKVGSSQLIGPELER